MWRCSILILLLIWSCNKRGVQEAPATSVVDSIVFRNYVGHCLVLRHGVEYYLTTTEPLTVDTLIVDTGDYHIKVVSRHLNDTTKRNYRLFSEYEAIGSLAEQAKYYKPVTNFKKATLRTIDDTLIDSLIITEATKTIYYLNGGKVSPSDSISMNEDIPFIPLEAPKK